MDPPQTKAGWWSSFANLASDTLPPSPPMVDASLSRRLPPVVIEKLNELHATKKMYQQKITMLESKPKDQRFGLDMTHKLLKKVEDDIAALKQEYGSSG